MTTKLRLRATTIHVRRKPLPCSRVRYLEARTATVDPAYMAVATPVYQTVVIRDLWEGVRGFNASDRNKSAIFSRIISSLLLFKINGFSQFFVQLD